MLQVLMIKLQRDLVKAIKLDSMAGFYLQATQKDIVY